MRRNPTEQTEALSQKGINKRDEIREGSTNTKYSLAGKVECE